MAMDMCKQMWGVQVAEAMVISLVQVVEAMVISLAQHVEAMAI